MRHLPDKLDRERVVLVVIDMQEKFRNLIHGMPEVIQGCSRLIRFWDRLGLPILVTEHYPAGLGSTLPELREILRDVSPLEKITFSCHGDEAFRDRLRSSRDQVVLCGIETHVCVYQTAYDLLRDHKQVALACDATSSRRQTDREIGLSRLAGLGCQNMSVEMMMFEILKVAKTDDFKLVADILRE